MTNAKPAGELAGSFSDVFTSRLSCARILYTQGPLVDGLGDVGTMKRKYVV